MQPRSLPPASALPHSLIAASLFSTLAPALLAEAPPLRVLEKGQTLELSWPDADIGYRVETLRSTPGAQAWQPMGQAASRFGGKYRLTIPTDGDAGFFRLFGGPAAANEPDYPGDFRDTNGDGIDGDFSRAIFLALPPFGNDLNPGTPTAPVATLEHAVELAESIPLRQSVYMARGTYQLDRPLRMPPRVSLFGWFDGTTNWTYATTNLTRIVGPSTVLVFGDYPGDDSDHAVRLAGLEIIASDATSPGASSYAVMARNRTTQLLFDRCRLVAGRGAPGAPGTSGTDGAPGSRGGAGAPANASGTGGAAGTATGSRAGGSGGSGGLGTAGAQGSPGQGLTLTTPTLAGVGGGSRTGCRRGQDGMPGSQGADGENGTNAVRNPLLWGALEAEGYLALAGVDGAPGGSGAGGGGGGGGGSNSSGTVVGCPPQQAAGGGGGGSGGLPGIPGRGGQGGGSSIAVYSYLSRVVLIDCQVEAMDGGLGGAGGHGGNGGPGGEGGSPGADFGYGASGGTGGRGGRGGASGAGSGGPGGHSFCLLFERPAGGTTDDFSQGSTFVVGRAGAGGAGGTNAVLGAAQPGRPGLASPIATRPQ